MHLLKKLFKFHRCPRCHKRLHVLFHRHEEHQKIDGVSYRYVCAACAKKADK